MKLQHLLLFVCLAANCSSLCVAQETTNQPQPEDATTAMLNAFKTHLIVMFGETHGNKQEYDWLCKLAATPAFADRVDDIVVEFGNSLYQKSVDRYISGEDVPIEQVQKAWRNMIGAVGPVSPVYPQFYAAIRNANLKRGDKHKMRIVLGDPYGDWDKIHNVEDLGPYVTNREQWYAQVVKDEVIAKEHHALLIMGAGHFRRQPQPSSGRGQAGSNYVERELRAAGADPYVVLFGTNAIGGYDNLDRRFDAWPTPAIIALRGNWVGDLPALPVLTGGEVPATQLKLADAADALFYAGPRDSLTQLVMPRSELDNTAYGKEVARRFVIQTGHEGNVLSNKSEVPQYPRPVPNVGNSTAQSAPPPLRGNINLTLPPRPPPQ
ncbi:hypothetical protein ACFPT7_10375 [Acidicapsa dinghuensis]|uniref:Haem-binding uptake Tiki superfamily ChaN domain-containing protein n=1 Tax=Acidicapsa dinghuensis TaxID=2218256 RepID=A0ABW1EFB4_9BACT|nr:hypothetical protein [Acidicapsa dinghuensis]